MAIARLAVVDGAKKCMVGNIVLDRQAVQARIAQLEKLATEALPARRASLKAEDLLKAAQEAVDRQIAQAQSAKAELEAVLSQLSE